ncbi:Rpn family recombination-promoting nuclease/putative transposase [Blautia sp. An81]|uniref:Rpn family recombination-promoting nuclease/putative transposase n=1 Tax=Blautia sp. An81 TaxID=1965659 RepID=UPI000B37A1B7|nr:Rpn family recombination-promoting nuclease/putative transposase [Blautia sp. An81]OUN21462.1 hypothetical protein B5G33_20735 [Blautia sp. An81]
MDQNVKQQLQLKDLTLLDRFLFSETIEDPKNLQIILEIILGRDIILKYLPQPEKEQKKSPLYRHIRVDVWSEDIYNTVYDVEVQKENTKNLPHRSRFYQSIIDSKLLKPGERNFNQLKDVYVIIIAPFDLFGYRKYQYTFEMRCREVPELAMEDGAIRIFLNTHGENPEEVNPELVELLDYMEHTNQNISVPYSSSRVRELQNSVNTIVENEEVGVRFMQAWEELALEREKGLEEGLAKGLEKGLKEGEKLQLQNLIRKKLQKGQTVEQIADALEETPERIQQLIDEMA